MLRFSVRVRGEPLLILTLNLNTDMIVSIMKTCSICKEGKPLEDFHKKAAAKDGRQSRCKKCAIDRVVQWQKDNPEKYKERWQKQIGNTEYGLRRKAKMYGVTVDELKEMFEKADGKCEICKREPYRALVVDHCHKTTKVRGILCEKCNQALGLMNDDIEALRAAAAYLEK